MLDARGLERRGPCALDVAANVDDEPGTIALPPAQVRQECARYRYGWGALLGFGDGDPTAVHDAAHGVDVAAAGVGRELQAKDGVGAGAGVQHDENEAGQVPALGVAIGCPEEPGGFAAGQPAVTRRCLGGSLTLTDAVR